MCCKGAQLYHLFPDTYFQRAMYHDPLRVYHGENQENLPIRDSLDSIIFETDTDIVEEKTEGLKRR